MEKIGDIKGMAYSSFLCMPAIVCLIFPALKSTNMDSSAFYLSTGFVYTIILLTSFVNGFGEGVA